MMGVELGERVGKLGWGIGQSKEIPKSTFGKNMISGFLGSLCSWEAVREAKKGPLVCTFQSSASVPSSLSPNSGFLALPPSKTL